jgi:hypothetical protein
MSRQKQRARKNGAAGRKKTEAASADIKRDYNALPLSWVKDLFFQHACQVKKEKSMLPERLFFLQPDRLKFAPKTQKQASRFPDVLAA